MRKELNELLEWFENFEPVTDEDLDKWLKVADEIQELIIELH
jgi:hypothetical protein